MLEQAYRMVQPGGIAVSLMRVRVSHCLQGVVDLVLVRLHRIRVAVVEAAAQPA